MRNKYDNIQSTNFEFFKTHAKENITFKIVGNCQTAIR